MKKRKKKKKEKRKGKQRNTRALISSLQSFTFCLSVLLPAHCQCQGSRQEWEKGTGLPGTGLLGTAISRAEGQGWQHRMPGPQSPLVKAKGKRGGNPTHMGCGISEDRCPAIPRLQLPGVGFKKLCKEDQSHVRASTHRAAPRLVLLHSSSQSCTAQPFIFLALRVSKEGED